MAQTITLGDNDYAIVVRMSKDNGVIYADVELIDGKEGDDLTPLRVLPAAGLAFARVQHPSQNSRDYKDDAAAFMGAVRQKTASIAHQWGHFVTTWSATREDTP